ncbi:MAG: PDZ domain-containing protein, partial [Thermoanaerobaculia bacterium]|nr:PDZ domain-containing protein [Thermoanaerobaculia bacterium]
MINYYFKISVLLSALNCHIPAIAQELPRRAFLGIQMEPVTDDVQRVMQLPAAKGVLIQRVIPGSTAEAAGFQRGDVLLDLDGKAINTPNEAVAAVAGYRAGQTLRYTLIRGGKTISTQTVMQGLPKEQYTDLDVSYGTVKAGDAQLRTILTKPRKDGKLPAILFIQGIGCASVDTPFDTAGPVNQLVNRLARQGFAVMRVDKSGLGDSRGIPCAEIDFYTELEGYKQAFAALQQSASVDAANCFLFGHSMGGVMAPLVAQTYRVKGVAVYGTFGVNFMEYFTLTRRSIAESYNMPPAEADNYVKWQCECAAMLLSARLSRAAAVERNPDCGDVYDYLLLRDTGFWHQLYDLNLPETWLNFNSKVLSIRGSADYITTR